MNLEEAAFFCEFKTNLRKFIFDGYLTITVTIVVS